MRNLKIDIEKAFKHNGFFIFNLKKKNPKNIPQFLWQTREFHITTEDWTENDEIIFNSLCSAYPEINEEYKKNNNHEIYSKRITNNFINLDTLLSRLKTKN